MHCVNLWFCGKKHRWCERIQLSIRKCIIIAGSTEADKVECGLQTTPVSNSVSCAIENLDLLVVECSFDERPFEACMLIIMKLNQSP